MNKEDEWWKLINRLSSELVLINGIWIDKKKRYRAEIEFFNNDDKKKENRIITKCKKAGWDVIKKRREWVNKFNDYNIKLSIYKEVGECG